MSGLMLTVCSNCLVSNNLSNDAITDNTLSRVVNILVEALVLSSSRYLSVRIIFYGFGLYLIIIF